MREVSKGLGDAGRGLDFLKSRPRLWKWLIAPAVVTLVLLVGLVLGLLAAVDPLVAWIAANVPDWLSTIVGWIVRLLVVAGVGMAALFLFVGIAGAVAGPFNEMLSEAIEAEVTGRPGPPFALRAFVRDALLGIAHAVRRLARSLLWAVLLFALNFVPVIGTIAALVIGGYLAASGCAYDAYDAVLSRRGLAYRDKLAYLAQRKQRSLGLGGAVAGMLLVPGLNLVALGIGATAATLASIEAQNKN